MPNVVGEFGPRAKTAPGSEVVMRQSTCSESLIDAILKEADAAVPLVALLRSHGVRKPTLFKGWRKYARASGAGEKRRPTSTCVR